MRRRLEFLVGDGLPVLLRRRRGLVATEARLDALRGGRGGRRRAAHEGLDAQAPGEAAEEGTLLGARRRGFVQNRRMHPQAVGRSRDVVGRTLDRRIGRVDHQRLARRHRRAFLGDLLVAVLEARRIVLAGVDLARNLGVADMRRRRLVLFLEVLRLAAPQADGSPHAQHGPQEGRPQDAEDQRQVGAVHAERRRHRDEGEGSAHRLDQGERTAARMGQHQFAEAADQGETDQAARPGMGRRAADVAEADAGHAHHQKRQKQQRQAQPEEAEMVGAHHADAPGDEGDRCQDDGQAEGLQQQVRDVGARQAEQIVRRARRGVIERGIAGAVGEQRHHQHQAETRGRDTHDLHHAAAQEIAPALRQDGSPGLQR